MKTIITLIIFFSWPLWAQTFVGTIVAKKGDVKILRTPAGPEDKGPFALYEGNKYSYELAKIGKKIKPSEIIQSGADGKAKIVYPNGDYLVIGVGTTMVMPDVAEKAEAKDSSSVKLIYGRVRALISKSGPRNNMTVKTPTAVAGVRGTDFFTRSNPSAGTEITVLRGQVDMSSKNKPKEVVKIKTGFSAEAKPKAESAPKIIEATKEELLTLQGDTAVQTTKEEIASLPAETQEKLNTLAEKSKEAILNDIKLENEDLYKELSANKDLSPEDINTAVVAGLYQMAPSAKKKKPTQEEIDSIGKDVYEKYFNKKTQAK
ncbi:MAG: FecR domain-containing protein [Bdellovibrionales bacterium]|nr:FecR domain-containing protein [Bdellovibrionales bacterium]